MRDGGEGLKLIYLQFWLESITKSLLFKMFLIVFWNYW